MKTLELSKATMPLAKFARQWDGKPLILTSRGKPLIAIVDIRDMDEESLSLSTNPKFLAILKRSRVRLAREGGISMEEMRRRLGIPAKSRKKPTRGGKVRSGRRRSSGRARKR